MTAESLSLMLEEFLAESRRAVVIEDGATIFDFSSAKYSISGEHGKCVLHIWSEEKNTVRRVLSAKEKNGTLRLTAQRFGRQKPSKLEIVRDRDRRTPSARKIARAAYQQLLRRMLQNQFAGWTVDRITSEMDLERSFGPVYARGLVRQGRTGFAILGVNAQETQASIDAALTFGILWLDHCRTTDVKRCYVEGLKLFVPTGTSGVVRERMAHLDSSLAKWQLFEVSESTGELNEIDSADHGNIATRLVHCPDEKAARQRFGDSIRRINSIVQHAEAVVISPAEISFRLHGLEFGRARIGFSAESFRGTEEIVFGTGSSETRLTQENEEQFTGWLRQLSHIRTAHGQRQHPLWRMCPERWLESLVVRDVTMLNEALDNNIYSQVPAFSASDRAMIDVLTCTREGRLAVIELKADEDIHLPMQGLDYWARVKWHHERGEFQRFGYFAGRELSPEPPVLLLVAPALRVHPTTDTLLRYISPEISCMLLGIDERWREGVRVVFRKRPS